MSRPQRRNNARGSTAPIVPCEDWRPRRPLGSAGLSQERAVGQTWVCRPKGSELGRNPLRYGTTARAPWAASNGAAGEGEIGLNPTGFAC